MADQAKIYLNGNLVYQNLAERACVEDQDVVTGLELKAGINVLVFKVVNEVFGWQGSVRFTDAAGQPLKGLRVTLDPGGDGRLGRQGSGMVEGWCANASSANSIK